VLSQWPAAELYRAESRKEPRNWIVRWLNACGQVDDAAAARALRKYGRMVARKDSKVWVNLGPFQRPYAPFDFNSGMDTKDVTRNDAVTMEVIGAKDKVKPQKRQGLNEGVKAQAPKGLSDEVKKAVLDDLGEGYEFAKGEDGSEVLQRKAETQGAEKPQVPQIEQTPEPPTPQVETPATPKKTKAENPVSDGLQIARRNPKPLEEMKGVIDKVHDDGKLPRIKVDGKAPSGSNGVYRAWKSGEADSMGVRSRMGDVFTFAHEIGHFLDHQALGQKGQFASQTDSALQAWRDAVRESANIKEMLEARAKGEKDFNYSYYLQTLEIWARAYSQWLIEKILARELGSPELREKLKRERDARMAFKHQAGQWDEEDFKPIAAAIDELFRKKGWLLE
jgi:hypothetical protein